MNFIKAYGVIWDENKSEYKVLQTPFWVNTDHIVSFSPIPDNNDNWIKTEGGSIIYTVETSVHNQAYPIKCVSHDLNNLASVKYGN